MTELKIIELGVFPVVWVRVIRKLPGFRTWFFSLFSPVIYKPISFQLRALYHNFLDICPQLQISVSYYNLHFLIVVELPFHTVNMQKTELWYHLPYSIWSLQMKQFFHLLWGWTHLGCSARNNLKSSFFFPFTFQIQNLMTPCIQLLLHSSQKQHLTLIKDRGMDKE